MDYSELLQTGRRDPRDTGDPTKTKAGLLQGNLQIEKQIGGRALSDPKTINLTRILAQGSTPQYESITAERRPYDSYRPYRVTLVQRRGFRSEEALLRFCKKEFGLEWAPTSKEGR